MKRNRSTDTASMHREASALIPWYVNGTLDEGDRRTVDEHLRSCSICRDDLLLERRIHQGIMAAETGVDYVPAASLKRLQARLDRSEAQVSAAGAETDGALSSAAPRRPMHWQWAMAASIATMAVAVGLLAADRWMQLRSPAGTAAYHTVTSADPRSPDEVVRAVFSPNITLVELQAILDEAQLRIISGPTEAGVYSLAAKSARPVGASLALLRQHAAVRFAEGTRSDPTPRPSP